MIHGLNFAFHYLFCPFDSGFLKDSIGLSKRVVFPNAAVSGFLLPEQF
jgi:hypothetical protein